MQSNSMQFSVLIVWLLKNVLIDYILKPWLIDGLIDARKSNSFVVYGVRRLTEHPFWQRNGVHSNDLITVINPLLFLEVENGLI